MSQSHEGFRGSIAELLGTTEPDLPREKIKNLGHSVS